MNAILLDTLQLSRTLRDRGHFSPEQAKTLAEALGEAQHGASSREMSGSSACGIDAVAKPPRFNPGGTLAASARVFVKHGLPMTFQMARPRQIMSCVPPRAMGQHPSRASCAKVCAVLRANDALCF
jgi:hypothetical protein